MVVGLAEHRLAVVALASGLRSPPQPSGLRPCLVRSCRRLLAQVSKPAVSPTSKSARPPMPRLARRFDWPAARNAAKLASSNDKRSFAHARWQIHAADETSTANIGSPARGGLPLAREHARPGVRRPRRPVHRLQELLCLRTIARCAFRRNGPHLAGGRSPHQLG